MDLPKDDRTSGADQNAARENQLGTDFTELKTENSSEIVHGWSLFTSYHIVEAAVHVSS